MTIRASDEHGVWVAGGGPACEHRDANELDEYLLPRLLSEAGAAGVVGREGAVPFDDRPGAVLLRAGGAARYVRAACPESIAVHTFGVWVTGSPGAARGLGRPVRKMDDVGSGLP